MMGSSQTFANSWQGHGIFNLQNGLSYTEIPFRMINDLIVIPVLINGEQELNFILDSGTSSPVILNDKYVQSLELPTERTIHFQGAGLGNEVRGKVIPSMRMQIGGAYAERIGGVLLQRNPLSRLKMEGINIHGIIGATLFRSFAVEIDYLTQNLRLHKDDSFLQEQSYSSHDLKVEVSRPLLETEATINDSTYRLKLMIDTGFNNKLLIYDPLKVKHRPNRMVRIGRGYSGSVHASEGNIRSLSLANRKMFNILTFFPSSKSYKKDEVSMEQRDGIIGNSLLKQFCIVLDYAGQKMYVQEHLLNQPELANEKAGKSSLR
jgi:hypothetical protein